MVEDDARRIAAELDRCAGVAARARLDVGRRWEISVRLLYATYADGRPVHYVITNREHGQRCVQAQQAGAVAREDAVGHQPSV
jgi:hypothetical protein